MKEQHGPINYEWIYGGYWVISASTTGPRLRYPRGVTERVMTFQSSMMARTTI